MKSLKKNWLAVSNLTRNLVNFHPATQKSLMTLKSDPNFEEKLTFCLKNDIRNLMNFNSRSGKSENLYFDGIFL